MVSRALTGMMGFGTPLTNPARPTPQAPTSPMMTVTARATTQAMALPPARPPKPQKLAQPIRNFRPAPIRSRPSTRRNPACTCAPTAAQQALIRKAPLPATAARTAPIPEKPRLPRSPLPARWLLRCPPAAPAMAGKPPSRWTRATPPPSPSGITTTGPSRRPSTAWCPSSTPPWARRRAST